MHGGTIEAMMSQSCSSIAERTDVDDLARFAGDHPAGDGLADDEHRIEKQEPDRC